MARVPLVLAAWLLQAAGAAKSGLRVRAPTEDSIEAIQAESALLRDFHVDVATPVPPRGDTSATSVNGIGPYGLPMSSAGGHAAYLEDVCGVKSSAPVCYSGGKAAASPPAVQPGLVGHWTFDQPQALDVSGNDNHALTALVHGPSPMASGHSAHFRVNFMMVPDSPQFHVTDFSYSFWTYIPEEDGYEAVANDDSVWCPLLRKGTHQVDVGMFASAPALSMNRRTGQLRAVVTTTVHGFADGEHTDSNARILTNQWVHLALVHHAAHQTLLLYVNGILDASLVTQGQLVTNDFPLYVGNDPFVTDSCAFTAYIDELRAYSRAVAPHELQAEAMPALGGVDPSFVRLGCLDCTIQEAATSCPPSRHVCTSLELHTGGYQVAQALGWVGEGGHVWTHGAVVRGAAPEVSSEGPVAAAPAQDSLGLTLCCEGAAA